MIAKASRYGREDDWPNALKEAQKALRSLLPKLDDTEEWEQVKDNWALTKCDLLR